MKCCACKKEIKPNEQVIIRTEKGEFKYCFDCWKKESEKIDERQTWTR